MDPQQYAQWLFSLTRQIGEGITTPGATSDPGLQSWYTPGAVVPWDQGRSVVPAQIREALERQVYGGVEWSSLVDRSRSPGDVRVQYGTGAGELGSMAVPLVVGGLVVGTALLGGLGLLLAVRR